MIFDKLRATTARAIRHAKPRAIISIQAEIPGGVKTYALLFTTRRMEAGPLKKFPPR